MILEIRHKKQQQQKTKKEKPASIMVGTSGPVGPSLFGVVTRARSFIPPGVFARRRKSVENT